MRFFMGAPEHAHLAGARPQLPRRWSLYLRLSGRLTAQLTNYLPYIEV
jgi:hypothetical protein